MLNISLQRSVIFKLLDKVQTNRETDYFKTSTETNPDPTHYMCVGRELMMTCVTGLLEIASLFDNLFLLTFFTESRFR